jgi:hypothetical protein
MTFHLRNASFSGGVYDAELSSLVLPAAASTSLFGGGGGGDGKSEVGDFCSLPPMKTSNRTPHQVQF